MNRYHNKFHRHNHHTDNTDGDNDSQNDPIASEFDPFKGTFHLAGNLQFTNNNNQISSDDDVVAMGCDLSIGAYIIQGYTLNKVTDVEADTPNDKDVLRWDSSASAWVNDRPLLINLADVEDVTLSNELERQALIWDSEGEYWKNGYPYAVYADLAENYIAHNSHRVGDIVSASSGEFDVELCTRKSFSKMLGVISDNPGMLLDADLDNGTPIAYVGKVDILVSGPCKRGDIIVLSKIDGVGKRAGMFDKKYKIGYAMEDSYNFSITPVRCILKTV